MALGDMFKAKENEQLKARIAQLEAELTPEMRDHMRLREVIASQQNAIANLQQRHSEEMAKNNLQIQKVQNDLAFLKQQYQKRHAEEAAKFNQQAAKLHTELNTIRSQIQHAKAELIETDEEVLMQSFGLYKPHFAFANSTEYKDELARVRAKQKEMIKAGTAATGNTGWTVNGDARQGAKMIRDMQKLLVRAFNCECDDVIDHVKFNNIEAAENRIDASYSAVSKLGAVCGVAITPQYRKLKVMELYLAHEYQVEKQKEKEALKQLRAEERERAKLEKEIAEARKKIEKEQKHYANALKKIVEQITCATDTELVALEKKKTELEEQLLNLDEAMVQIDYREANQKAGYVYVISNVGAFGEGVYKIGMTRRLEPRDRIDELGDASVPFDFDIHALIFSDNAPALEAALHRAFEDRKLNMINTRREFFRVSLEEIKKVIKENFDQTVDFIDVPAAEQYRQSELLRRR